MESKRFDRFTRSFSRREVTVSAVIAAVFGVVGVKNAGATNTCIPENSKCIPGLQQCCEGLECVDQRRSRTYDGLCKPVDKCKNVTCNPGCTCKEGKCDCPPPNPCEGVVCPVAGNICVDGSCICDSALECCLNTDCPPNSRCINGECTSTLPCPPGRKKCRGKCIPVEDRCTKPKPDNNPCRPGQKKCRGKCVPQNYPCQKKNNDHDKKKHNGGRDHCNTHGEHCDGNGDCCGDLKCHGNCCG